MLGLAWELFDAGDMIGARAEARRVLDAGAGDEIDSEDLAEARLVTAQIDFLEDDADAARAALASIAAELAPDADLQADAANLALAVGDLAVAAARFERALELDPSMSDAAYGCGLVAGEQGKPTEQISWFLRAAELDAEEPDPPWAMTVDEFATAAEAALAELPAVAIEHLENVPVIVEAAPSRDLISSGIDPRLLGLFSGVPLGEKSSIDSSGQLDAIHLYQRNLERHCESREDLEAEIRITVLHETAHFFGLEDHDLDGIGLG